MRQGRLEHCLCALLPGKRRRHKKQEAQEQPSAVQQAASPATAAAVAASSQANNGTAAPAPAAAPAAPLSPRAAYLLGIGGACLTVHVLGARGLAAADAGGSSDPYCVLEVGQHRASTRVVFKSLEPSWGESFTFSAQDLHEAAEEAAPCISLRVFDCDLLSADDFLGDAELGFEALPQAVGQRVGPLWLPLRGAAVGGTHTPAGELQLTMWLEPPEQQQCGAGPFAECTLPGAKQLPLVVHCSGGHTLYEEPLLAWLAVTLETARGVPPLVPPPAAKQQQPPSSSSGAGAQGAGGVPSSGSPPGSPRAQLARERWQAGRRGRGGGEDGADDGGGGGSRLSRASLAPSSGMGEDSYDEETEAALRGLDEVDGEGDNRGGSWLSWLAPSGDDSLPSDQYGGGAGRGEGWGPLAAMGRMGAAGKAVGAAGKAVGAAGKAVAFGLGTRLVHVAGAVASALAVSDPAAAAGRLAAGSGKPDLENSLAVPAEGQEKGAARLYARLTLGGQSHTSFVKRERTGGGASWRQLFVFVVPLPMRNRLLNVEIHRTHTPTSRGRLLCTGQVWLHDLLPPGAHPPGQRRKVTRRCSVALSSLQKGGEEVPSGEVSLLAAVVDADVRRQLYGQGLLRDDAADREGWLGETPSGAWMERLQSVTHLPKELKRRFHQAEQQAQQQEQPSHHSLKAAARAVGLLRQRKAPAPMAAPPAGLEVIPEEGAQLPASTAAAAGALLPPSPYEDVPSTSTAAALLPPSPYEVAASMTPAASGTSDASSTGLPSWPASTSGSSAPAPGHDTASPAGAAAAPVAAPPGSVWLRLESLRLLDASCDCFVVLRLGPNWGRSAPLLAASADSGGVLPVGWELRLPVLDPSTLLLLCVFQQPGWGQKAATQKRTSILRRTPPQLLGKLRVRLSCLTPSRRLSADLPLLAPRARGGDEVGWFQMSMQVTYEGNGALVRAYFQPPLPHAAYLHGLQAPHQQHVAAKQAARIAARWLDNSSPPLEGGVVLAMLDLERETFAMSRLLVNWRRLQLMLLLLRRLNRWRLELQWWERPHASGAVLGGMVLSCYWPGVTLPPLLGWAVYTAYHAAAPHSGLPPPMERDPPGIASEHEELATSTANPYTLLKRQVTRLQAVALNIQRTLESVAGALERAWALLSWQDPVATSCLLVGLAALCFLLLLLGPSTLAALGCCVLMRPPQLRSPTPAAPLVFFRRLPTRADHIM